MVAPGAPTGQCPHCGTNEFTREGDLKSLKCKCGYSWTDPNLATIAQDLLQKLLINLSKPRVPGQDHRGPARVVAKQLREFASRVEERGFLWPDLASAYDAVLRSRPLQFVTSRFHYPADELPPGFVPVGIVGSMPRFAAPAFQKRNLTLLAPTAEMRDLGDFAKFTELYVAHLEKIGVATIRRTLTAYQHAARAEGLVLLCYENLVKPKKGKEWCHRRVFAEWWQSKTGERIADLEECPVHTRLLE